jgi:threonine-phosphate decarboxylase
MGVKFTHGGDIYGRGQRAPLLDFSANINPLGMPEAVRRAAMDAVDGAVHYPDPYCRALRDALAEAEGLPASWFFCANGAADALFRLAIALRPKRALITAPTFSEYTAALHAARCRIRRHTLREERGFALTEEILGELDGADAVFLCNPNNPTGALIQPLLLREILSRCAAKGILLLVDECFNDFLGDPEGHTLRGEVERYPNLVLLRSFTKLYALPGVRLGYCVCSDAALMDRMYASGQPWGVSVIAQACGLAALGEREFAETTRRMIAAERRRLSEGLRGLGLTVFDGAANFILFKSGFSGDLAAELAARGVLIRKCGDYAGLDARFFRVAVRRDTENDILLKILTEVLHG